MTRKDYELIARQFRLVREELCEDRANLLFIQGYDHAVHRAAVALDLGNPRFDRERFLKACGIQS